MYYQLIFSTSEPKLFLIDEPEISLHVEWQRQFLSDLQAIASRSGHAFLIATHSPQIINGRLDLASALDGGIITSQIPKQE
jgi:ABC-type glutathione transport system ATPase component